MKNTVLRTVAAMITGALASVALAGEPADKAVEETLRKALSNPAMGLEVGTVETSAIPGLYEVQYSSGPVVYSSADGSHIVLGDLYQVTDKGFTNLTQKRRDGDRVVELAKVDEKDMIIFAPEGEPRATVTVFTDTSCPYCMKLHKEVPELNKRGVEVRYLAYPRQGMASAAARQLATAWCAENKQEVLTKLNNRESVPENVCPGNPVANQYQLGQQLGVQGTPALILEDGTLIPGYQSAADLMVTMGLN